MRMLLLTGFVVAFGLAGTGIAAAQSADDLIAGRKAGMDMQSAIAGLAKRAVDAKEDVKPLTGGANAIAAWAKAIPGMFPAGSDKGNTKVAPEAFSDRAGFEKAAMALNTGAVKLAAAADTNDKAAFATAFGEVGTACVGCHRAYRQR